MSDNPQETKRLIGFLFKLHVGEVDQRKCVGASLVPTNDVPNNEPNHAKTQRTATTGSSINC